MPSRYTAFLRPSTGAPAPNFSAMCPVSRAVANAAMRRNTNRAVAIGLIAPYLLAMKHDRVDDALSFTTLPRRRFVGATLAALAWPASAGAAALLPTPRQSTGPYYPLSKPPEQDADLVRMSGRNQLAHGQVIRIFGRVLGSDGLPLEGAQIEIWQANAFGRYAHPSDTSSAPLDPNFQGFGRLSTDAEGRYQFRTVKPAPYSSRTPHVHFRISGSNFNTLTT